MGMIWRNVVFVLIVLSVPTGALYWLSQSQTTCCGTPTPRGDISTLVSALKTYEMGNLEMPTTEQGLEALVERPTREPLPDQWRQLMKKLPIDRWDRLYQYRNPGTRNPDGFDLFSLGEDGIESDDDIGNWE